jgi:P2 family phage contractile tail tube protein
MTEFNRFGQITNAEVYLEDNSLVGICKEFKVPKIEWNTIDHETLGQVAVFKAPARPLQALEGSMTWDTIDPDLLGMSYTPTKVFPFQLHSLNDVWGPDGRDEGKSFTLITTVGLQFVSSELGAAKLGDLQGQEVEFTCTRLSQRVHSSDKVIFSVDVFANRARNGQGDIWPR